MSGSVSDGAFFALKDTRKTQVMEKGGRHMGIHRGTVSNGVQQPPATFTGNGYKVYFLKDVPSWFQHGNRGLKGTATDGDNILYAAPLLFFYHGPTEPERPLMQWKKKTEESMSYRSMMNAAAKAVKNLHRCEICGRTFATGQALGGHKTFHRKLKLVQTKTEQGQCGEVKEYVTRMLLPGLLPEEAPPKKTLDFDLNVPYQE
ncbi:hypothetical protein V6N13_145146 [Hibiscus sabdariffa]|uniref:C2H2-type domain-containing protein n=1 Tax=Hibiscus sabdariffa TaxID=183260 RepID=A0ABR2FMT0_9ROSI